MTQSSERSRYRKFVFASAERRLSSLGDTVSIVSPRLGRSYRLDPVEFEIARLFDGTRSAGAVRSAAAELGHEIEADQLEAFACDLAQADLLLSGTHDPLPVPPQSDEEARAIGWAAARPPAGAAGVTPTSAVPPSTMPGTRATPSLTGTLTNRIVSGKGQVTDIVHQLPLAPLLPIGWLASIWVAMLPALALLIVAFGVIIFQIDVRASQAAHDLGRLRPFGVLAAVVLAGFWLSNIVAQLARAATIQRFTGEVPRFGLTYWLQFFPWFATSTSGVPERTDLATRLRIIGAAPAANLGVVFMLLGLWLCFFRTGSLLAPVLLGMAVASGVLLLIGINPLLKRDGYSLIATYLKTPDLREQSIMSLFGVQKPWQRGPTLSSSQMSAYIVLCLTYIGLIIWTIMSVAGPWIQVGWGITGVAVAIAFFTLFIYDVYRRIGSRRTTVGNIKLAMPSTWIWVVLLVLGTCALLPYQYSPSGEFQVLARNQAEVHALTSGDIREVHVQEGQLVKAGDLLIKLNDDSETAAATAMQASIDALQYQVALASGGKKPEEIAASEQQVAEAQKKYDFSYAESSRIDQAYRRNAASIQERDQAVGQTAVDREALEVAKANLALMRTPAQENQIKAMEAEIDHDKAELVFDKQQLAYTEIRAPIDGRVVSQMLLNAVGHYLDKGQIIAVIQDDRLDAQIYMPEVEMGDLRLGAPVRAKAFAYPGTEFSGVVKSIAPAAQSSYTMGQSNPTSMPQSSSGYDYVRVLCEVNDPDGRLKPDMTGEAKVAGNTYPAAEAFLRPVVRGLMVEVWSWLP